MTSKIFKFLVGCDPECFITVDGEPVSAHDLVPGSKHKPFAVKDGAIQPDGLAAEFNIEPTDDIKIFCDRIGDVYNVLGHNVRMHNPKAKLSVVPFIEFDGEYFKSLPEECKILGCDPDFNYKGEINPSPTIKDEPFRTAAGHIHIGWTEGKDSKDAAHFEDCRFIAEKFHTMGVFENDHPLSRERINYYGMLGSFRPKPYGVELRAPDNLWIKTREGRAKMFSKVQTVMSSLG